MKVFVWSTDEEESFSSFKDCLAYWEYEAELDSSIDVAEMFSYEGEAPDVRDEEET
jgi:hypothetical protein